MTTANKNTYDESSMRVLKGLEPVRERPGMYTDTSSPNHIIQEVIDNAADEALAGFSASIHVTINDDDSITVEDAGRGIPVGLHPEEKVPVVTLAFTRLHAGGKFNKKDGTSAYAFSGGLHGVGVSVTTALSHMVKVEVKRDGKLYEVQYAENGSNIGTPKVVGQVNDGTTGTKVTVWPDAKYFDSPKISKSHLSMMLRSKAVMLPGVTVRFTVNGHTQEWLYENGLPEFLKELAGEREYIVPAFVGEKYHKVAEGDGVDDTGFANGEGASFAFAWCAESAIPSMSYVNLINTPLGGTHESGLKAGVFEAIKTFVDVHNLLPRGVKLQQEDVASRMGWVLSSKILDPQFQGQIKEKLNSRHAHKLVLQMVKDPFEIWLNNNVESGKLIAELAINNALTRQKAGQKVERKKGSGLATLPGKLTDCENTTDNEIYLVEGDSAGGSAKMARNKDNQAVLPLRGKVLNTFEIESGKIFANKEVHDMSVAFGVDVHTIDDDPAKVLANIRYQRIFLMTDADVDGAHIRTLLLTMFYRHFPLLIVHGHVFVAECPLFKIDVPAQGKAKPAQRIYVLDEVEKQSTLKKLEREKVNIDKVTISRFKGLGEMNASQLREAAMDPDLRRVSQVKMDIAMYKEFETVFSMLMASKNSEARRVWMTLRGTTIDADI